MKRRDFLKVIGCAAVAPTLIVKEHKLVGPKIDDEIIPTGFGIIDEALGGGIHKGTLATLGGESCTMVLSMPPMKTFAESFAMRMGLKASVGLVTPFHCGTITESAYEGDVYIHRPKGNFQAFMEQLAQLMKLHDVVVLINNANLQNAEARLLSQIAHENDSALVILTFGRCKEDDVFGSVLCQPVGCWHRNNLCEHSIYCSDAVLFLSDQNYGDDSIGYLYTISVLKNRWGPAHIIEPVVLDRRGFTPLRGFTPPASAPKWRYERKTGIVRVPYGGSYPKGVRAVRRNKTLTIVD